MQGPARDAAVRRRQREAVHDRLRQHLGGVDWRDPARRSWRSSSRAATSSSASRCSTSTTCSRRQSGRGVVNILAADQLVNAPKLYASFLLWMLSELFEHLPEVGDPDKPKLVFFFDEAHLLFTDAPSRARAEDRAGRAADSIEGRRRVFRHAESAGRARDGARAARQPRATRAARVHAARSEGGQHGGEHAAAESEARHRAGDHASSAWARRSCRSSTRRARRRSSSGRSSCRQPHASARSPRPSARQ